jgi:hypothetical protein
MTIYGIAAVVAIISCVIVLFACYKIIYWSSKK